MGEITESWPKYKCHKVVSAVRISNLYKENGIWMVSSNGLQFAVPDQFIERFNPQCGDYIVGYPETGRLTRIKAQEFATDYEEIHDDKETPAVP